VVIVTNGYMIFDVGRGYHTREVELLGGRAINMEASSEIFREQVEMACKAVNEEAFCLVLHTARGPLHSSGLQDAPRYFPPHIMPTGPGG